MDLSGLNAAILAGMPAIGRSILGPLFRAITERFVRCLKSELGPAFRSQVDSQGQKGVQAEPDDPDDLANSPRDLLSFMVRYASQERPDQLSLDNVARRIAVSNVHAMAQTTVAAINLILNVIASDPEHNTISALRAELASATSGASIDAAFWTRANVAGLVKADSVARETVRLHSPTNRAMARKVVADGVKTEDGLALPRGCTVSMLSYPIHRGEEYFIENGEAYEPFRYCKQSGGPGGLGSPAREFHSAETASLVTTGPQFLPFGHGKTACPGRFILDFELKMLLAYLLQNYDVRLPSEYGGKRPENIWVAESYLPPLAQIQVRRR
jgi:tenellin biosynthesis cytochrome P450 monooxygenase